MTNAYTYVGEELELFAAAVRWKTYFASHVTPHIGRRVLEVGAGIGGTTAQLCDGSQKSWICLEPDESLAAILESRIRDGELPQCCSVRVGTTERLEATESNRKFDTILYIDVLEHLADHAAEASRAARLLDRGGRLIVLSPAHGWLFSPFDESVGHHRRYTKKSLAAIIPASLRCVKLVYLDSVGLLASLANRALLRKAMPSRGQIETWDSRLVPVSRLLDPIFFHTIGKSVVGIWSKEA